MAAEGWLGVGRGVGVRWWIRGVGGSRLRNLGVWFLRWAQVGDAGWRLLDGCEFSLWPFVVGAILWKDKQKALNVKLELPLKIKLIPVLRFLHSQFVLH